MDPRQLIEQNIELIDRLVARACRRVGIAVGEVEDVASVVKVALVENDYAILRRYEGRSSLATYLTTVIQRTLADQRERTHGRWRPSPEAERLGERAVLIEEIIRKQGRRSTTRCCFIQSFEPSVSRAEIDAIAARLPVHAPRPREVQLPPEEVMPLAAPDRADTTTLDGELRDVSRRAGIVLRKTIALWPADDRLLVRLRFESSLTIADIARRMNLPQRPLYRRVELLLDRLREALLAAGIDSAAANDLFDASDRIEMNFDPLAEEKR